MESISVPVFGYANISRNNYPPENGSETNETNIILDDPTRPEIYLPYPVLLTIAIYLTVVGILSTFGNVLFILTVIRWRYLRNNSHMLLLLNMAGSDLAISIAGYPYTTISGYLGEWNFGEYSYVLCQMYAFLCFTFSQVNMNTLVAVSVFRYIAICHPHMKHLLTSSTSMFALGIIWCHALFWTIAPLVGWSSYTFEPTRISCSIDWNDRTVGGQSYVISATLFCYVSHLIILIWCYRRIFQMVYRLKRKTTLKDIRLRFTGRNTTNTTLDTNLSFSSVGNQQQSEQEEEDIPDSPTVLPRCQSLIVFSFTTENLSEMELHVLGMNIAMVVAFIAFWSPYAIISCISAFSDKLSPVWYIFPTIFAKTSCMMNPILYGLTNSFLRKQLLLVLRGFLGLTSPLEDFEVMKKRQQDGLYNKEGIFVGKRTGAITHCPCEGCIASSRQVKLLLAQRRMRGGNCKNHSLSKLYTSRHDQKPQQSESNQTEEKGAQGAEMGKDEKIKNNGNSESDIGNGKSTPIIDDVLNDTTNETSHITSSRTELPQTVKKTGTVYANSNAIILSVSTLSKDVTVESRTEQTEDEDSEKESVGDPLDTDKSGKSH